MENSMRERYQFFAKHAGYIVGRHAEGALDLARAERWAEQNAIEFLWEDDDIDPAGMMDDNDLEKLDRMAYVFCCEGASDRTIQGRAENGIPSWAERDRESQQGVHAGC
jgi:hypothetical protein